MCLHMQTHAFMYGQKQEMQGQRQQLEECVYVCVCLHKPTCLRSWLFYSSVKADG